MDTLKLPWPRCGLPLASPRPGDQRSIADRSDRSGNSPYPCFIARARCWLSIGFGIASRSRKAGSWLRGQGWWWLNMDWCHISHIQSNPGHQYQPLSISHQGLETREERHLVHRHQTQWEGRCGFAVGPGVYSACFDVSVGRLKPLAAISFVWRCSAATSLEVKLSTLLRLPSCFHSPRCEAPRTVH